MQVAEASVKEMWESLETKRVSEVAKENGLTTQALVALFDLSGLTGRRAADPTPEEIRSRAAAERKRWTPEVEQQRWIAARKFQGLL